MTAVASALATFLWVYFLILLARLVLDYVQLFARSWEPKGPALVFAEAIYTVTDPPLPRHRTLEPHRRCSQRCGPGFDFAEVDGNAASS